MAKTTTAKRATKKTKTATTEPVVKMTVPTEKPAKAMKVAAKSMTAPSYDQIAARAYEIWAEKGYPAGQDLENWRQAEAELCGGTLTNAA